jgi:hypothetical protein
MVAGFGCGAECTPRNSANIAAGVTVMATVANPVNKIKRALTLTTRCYLSSRTMTGLYASHAISG